MGNYEDIIRKYDKTIRETGDNYNKAFKKTTKELILKYKDECEIKGIIKKEKNSIVVNIHIPFCLPLLGFDDFILIVDSNLEILYVSRQLAHIKEELQEIVEKKRLLFIF